MDGTIVTGKTRGLLTEIPPRDDGSQSLISSFKARALHPFADEIAASESASPHSRVPDAPQRLLALRRRAGTQERLGALQNGPRLCSAPPRTTLRIGRAAALRPGHEIGVWGMLSPRHCELYDATAPLFPHHLAYRRAFSFSRLNSPELCFIFAPSNPRGRREGRVPTGTRGPLREMHTQEEPHSSIQVTPITRPSLRDGWTAYAVLSREPNFPLASLAARIG